MTMKQMRKRTSHLKSPRRNNPDFVTETGLAYGRQQRNKLCRRNIRILYSSYCLYLWTYFTKQEWNASPYWTVYLLFNPGRCRTGLIKTPRKDNTRIHTHWSYSEMSVLYRPMLYSYIPTYSFRHVLYGKDRWSIHTHRHGKLFMKICAL